jgi:hypothetical protein
MQVQNYRILWIIPGRWGWCHKALYRQAERREAVWLAGEMGEKIGAKA